MQKLIYTFLALTLLISCSQNREKDFQIPSEKEVQAIILAVIRQDSLPVMAGKVANFPLSSETQPYKVSLNESNMPVVIPGTGIRLKDALSIKADSISDKLLFSESDTAYLMLLDKLWLRKPYAIQGLRTQGISLRSKETLFKKLQETQLPNKSFYVFSNPIISEDHTKAYIEVAFACDRLCGYGHGYSLLKEKGKWRVSNEVITYFE